MVEARLSFEERKFFPFLKCVYIFWHPLYIHICVCVCVCVKVGAQMYSSIHSQLQHYTEVSCAQLHAPATLLQIKILVFTKETVEGIPEQL